MFFIAISEDTREITQKPPNMTKKKLVISFYTDTDLERTLHSICIAAEWKNQPESGWQLPHALKH